MMQKLFYGFCSKVKMINTFQQLQAIMNPPTPENHRRLSLSIQQLIQSQPINWKFVHRLHQIKDQFQVQVNIESLIEKLKTHSIDSSMQKFAVDLAQEYFTVDENFFSDVYYQLLRMNDLLFVNQIKLLQIYFSYPEFLDQDVVIPRIAQELLAHDELEQYDLEKAMKIFSFNINHLSEENQKWMLVLKEDLGEQFCKTLPTFDLKQFREFIHHIRTSEFQDEKIKQTIFKFYRDNKPIFSASLLLEMMNFCNVKFYSDEEIKYDLLIQLNFKKITNMNESKFVNRTNVPHVPQREQEILANLITLSGIQLDRQFLETYQTDAFAKRRQQINQMQEKDQYVKQIVKEILSYIDNQFNYLMNVVRSIEQLQLTIPELLNEIADTLRKILERQIVNPPDLLYVLNVLDSSNIYFEIKDCIGIQFLNKYLQDSPYSFEKIHYLQRLYAVNKDQQAKQILEKSYTQDWPLENIGRQALLKLHFKETISHEFVNFFNQAIDHFVKTKRFKFNKLVFYKIIVKANWQDRLLPEHKEYFLQGEEIVKRFKKQSSKTLETSSFFEQEIKNDLLLHMPKNFKLKTNQYVDGTEIDIIIENEQGKKLYLQIHGIFHFYSGTKRLNYLTTLENYYLQRIGNFASLNYFSRDNNWKNDTKQAVQKLLSCLVN